MLFQSTILGAEFVQGTSAQVKKTVLCHEEQSQ